MTAPVSVPEYANGILLHFRRMEASDQKRMQMAETIHQVREGNINQLVPDELNWSLSFKGSPVANFIDIVARDMAEGIAPLPALACVSGRMVSQTDRRKAEQKNRVGLNYWERSNLEIQMMSGADQYVSYGFLPFYVEPNVPCKRPHIFVENPRFAHYELDRYGEVVVYAYRIHKTVDQLCAEFPTLAGMIRYPNGNQAAPGDQMLTMLRWVDKTYVTLLLPDRKGLVLNRFEHKLSRVPARIAVRPGESSNPRGQFDDVIWVQVARAIMSMLALEAASMAVQAPIGVPSDMDQLTVGPNALMQTDNPEKIRRLNLELPPQIFAENQNLDQELRVGARYPEARSGVQQASVITGKGIEALLGSFDSQIQGAQLVMRPTLEAITSMCLEMDEVWWPNESKTVSGTSAGTTYEFDYTPASDIAGRWDCTVTYGFAAGLRPQQAMILMMQLEGAGLIAKGTVQKNMPMGVDPIQEGRDINIERSREALEQGVFALVQSSGQMAAQGADPMPIIKLSVDVIKNLEKGLPIEEAVDAAFTAMQAAQQAAQQQAAAEQAEQQAGQPPDSEGAGDQEAAPGGDPTGMGSDGRPTGVAAGQAGQPAGGRPSLEQMITGFRGNGTVPIMTNEIRRSRPIGTA